MSDLKNQIASVKPPQSIQALIQKASAELGKALPAHMTPERLVRIALTCIRTNPKLAECTPESFLGSLFVLAQLGLEPVAGRAYLLPFKNKQKDGGYKLECQSVIGYKGYIDLFYRHESSLALDVQTVREQDEFDYCYGTQSFLKHKPAKSARGRAVGFYAIAKLRGGVALFRYMSAEEALDHGREHAQTFDRQRNEFYRTSPWVTDFESMAMKTCVHQISKLLPLSIELQRALTVDETSRDYREGAAIDPLDLPVTTNWDKPQLEEKKEELAPPATQG